MAREPSRHIIFGHGPQGGFSSYAPGPSKLDLTATEEATFGYSISFPDSSTGRAASFLVFVDSGDNDSETVSCSGDGRSPACFSARLMWHAKGTSEVYTYLPPTFEENKRVRNVKPRGWPTVAQRVRLNDVGEQTVSLVASVINVNGLILRDKDEGKMRGLQMQTFFGDPNATPKDQDVYLSDLSVAITQKL
ncbi:polysaccharide lyase family 14 protein [Macrolepiota fuliginosa MF-IS2]|uniref:Polysaccharide lyase family 14 protein n=1 Tax=Macrolepiota fuliginosa MF-IS2 TaxID=1400762 RepID=A0A9P6C656_9AGAR|nr:polysaccharide lyase family 14 protein [Macrolepiota fuliginosa MF-IS2]